VSYKPKALPVIASPNVIPMADIMLVLLIIFMVITPLITSRVQVAMATAANAEDMSKASHDDAIIVAITRDGRIFLSPGNRMIERTTITDDVKDLVAARLDKTVYVRSDARAKYADVVSTVDGIRSAGVENIGLLTEKIATPPAPNPPRGGLD
jgi:biopolymer transport protein TolR